jgi:sugar/nucleoside kinase (ribokinase family)
MLVGIVEHWGDYLSHLEPITRLANAVGALATTQYGAIPALPTRAAVEHFMKHPK